MDNRAPGDTRSSRWVWIVCVWFGFGLLDATETVLTMHAEGMHHPWGRLFLTGLLIWIPWALLTPPIMRLNQLYPILPWRTAKAWIVHLSACAATDFIHAGWFAALQRVLNPYGKP